MTVALLIPPGVWLGATLGYIFAGIMPMGRDVVAHVYLRSARWVEVTISHARRGTIRRRRCGLRDRRSCQSRSRP